MCDTAGLEALIGLIGLRVVSYMWEKWDVRDYRPDWDPAGCKPLE
jgi:hypothetical protein